MPTSDALRLSHREAGGGFPLVLIHGFPFTSALWVPQLRGLADTARVVAPDLRGFGDSPLAAVPYTMTALADDVVRLIDRLGIERAVVGGLSMGGYVAFEILRHHRERLAGLLLADTRAEPDTADGRAARASLAERVLLEGAAPVVESLIPRLLSDRTRREKAEIEAGLRRMMSVQDPRTIAAALEAMARRADARPLLPTIRIPTLVIGGSDDSITPPESLRAMAGRIPDADVEVLDGAGHVSNLETPEGFNTAVRRLLARIR